MATTKTATKNYRGLVMDRLADDAHRVVYRSRPCTTWEEAYRRAEAQRRWQGDRYAVVVVEE